MEGGDESTFIRDRSALLGGAGRGAQRAYVIVITGPSVGDMFKIHSEVIVGRGEEADVRLRDVDISRRHARMYKEGGAVYVEDLESTNGTYVNGAPIRRHRLSDGDKIQIGTTSILKFTYHDQLDEQFQRQLYQSALRDGLTGAYNKSYFSEQLESEYAFAARHGTPLSLLVVDVDELRKINDVYGQSTGDEVLAELAGAVAGSVRREDVFARCGGEQFALLSRGIDAEGALLLAERTRCAVEEHRFTRGGLTVTVSVGVASVPHPKISGPTALLSAADQALYAAKERGRNRVEAHGRLQRKRA